MTHSIVFPRGVEGKAVSRIDFDRHFRRGEGGKIGKRGTRTHRLHVDYYQFKFQFQFQFHRSVSKAWHSEPDIPFGRGNLAELDYKPSLPTKHDPPLLLAILHRKIRGTILASLSFQPLWNVYCCERNRDVLECVPWIVIKFYNVILIIYNEYFSLWIPREWSFWSSIYSRLKVYHVLEKFWYVRVYKNELNINIFRRGCTRKDLFSTNFIFPR